MDIEKGFYYHYKDPNKAYEVLGVAWNTEAGGDVHLSDPEEFKKSEVVIYRPLYESSLAYQDKRYWIRPAKMFFENITKDGLPAQAGKTFPRFTRITDPVVVAELEKIRNQMYP